MAINMAERMAKVETEVTNLKDSNTREHDELKEMIKEFIDSADSKFASKTTEKLVYGMVALILVGFVTGVIALVIK